MSETFASLAEFLAANAERGVPHQDLGRWLADGDRRFAEVRLAFGTREVFAILPDTGEVEVLGTVTSVLLADALLRLPKSSSNGLAWVRGQIATAPKDPKVIVAAIVYQKAAWKAVEEPAGS